MSEPFHEYTILFEFQFILYKNYIFAWLLYSCELAEWEKYEYKTTRNSSWYSLGTQDKDYSDEAIYL